MHIVSEGPSDARIMLVGDQPRGKEIAVGRPFVGGMGTILDGLLMDAGITRKECYLTHALREDETWGEGRDRLMGEVERVPGATGRRVMGTGLGCRGGPRPGKEWIMVPARRRTLVR